MTVVSHSTQIVNVPHALEDFNLTHQLESAKMSRFKAVLEKPQLEDARFVLEITIRSMENASHLFQNAQNTIKITNVSHACHLAF